MARGAGSDAVNCCVLVLYVWIGRDIGRIRWRGVNSSLAGYACGVRMVLGL